ncbi:hypothetical protein JDV02_007458 [Purpureocillium takamizusanense]|uniref:Uncharacterized protein n=1 Tax=Purpureocillium takamizusanense TaxID=2060973 RepID=A0A9Q8VCC0_9HYPO|nr:uncharacterized protein JDV02_007458 [Purpureocillium takamizusanense]UNI21470.1 hypothetical protein JDV02_007458 [Purpureocillium takamizusanense]
MRFAPALVAVAALGGSYSPLAPFAAASASASASTTATTQDRDWAQIITATFKNNKPCGATANDVDCRTPAQAAPFVAQSFSAYGLTCPAEQAAVLAVMALESGEFHYKHNMFPPPGRPGQGTANMQSPLFNLRYAKSIPAVAPHVANVTEDMVTGGGNGLPAAELNRILALVTVDEYNFGSGAWFMSSQCAKAVRNVLRRTPDQGWLQYNAQCVGVPGDDPDRLAYWTRAKAAMDIK